MDKLHSTFTASMSPESLQSDQSFADSSSKWSWIFDAKQLREKLHKVAGVEMRHIIDSAQRIKDIEKAQNELMEKKQRQLEDDARNKAMIE